MLVNMGSYRLVIVGTNTAHQYDPSNLGGLALHKMQACLLNYVFHNSVVSKSIPGYPA